MEMVKRLVKTEAAVSRCLSKWLVSKIRNIYKKTPVLESLFNKVSGLEACNFIKKRLQYRFFTVNNTKF